jgi:hypothetical protein
MSELKRDDLGSNGSQLGAASGAACALTQECNAPDEIELWYFGHPLGKVASRKADKADGLSDRT